MLNGELVFETTNDHSYTVGRLTKPKHMPGRVFDAPDGTSNGICTGMSVRWVRRSIQGLGDAAMEQRIGVNGTASSQKAHGVLQSMGLSLPLEKRICQYCRFYGLDVKDYFGGPTFEAAWDEARVVVGAAEGTASQGFHLLVNIPGHMAAMKYCGPSQAGRFLDPNHGLYAYDRGSGMVRDVDEHFREEGWVGSMYTLFLVEVCSDQVRAEPFPPDFVPSMLRLPGRDEGVNGGGRGAGNVVAHHHHRRRGCTLF